MMCLKSVPHATDDSLQRMIHVGISALYLKHTSVTSPDFPSLASSTVTTMYCVGNPSLLSCPSQHYDSIACKSVLPLTRRGGLAVFLTRRGRSIAPPYNGASRMPLVSASILKDKITHLFDSFVDSEGKVEVKGTVLLQRQNLLDLNAQVARLGDNIADLLGNKVELQLVSANAVDPKTGVGVLSEKAYLGDWSQLDISLTADTGSYYSVKFSLDKDFGVPGAFLVLNHHPSPFLLRLLTLEFSDKSQIHFPCESWVFNWRNYAAPRVFYSNHVCLPGKSTPAGLRELRDLEMKQMRGDGTGERKPYDRIYDYDVYNDLGSPDTGKDNARPILVGSKEFPYPRRCRTGRARTKTDPSSERPTLLPELVYVPTDEIFGHMKTSDFLADSIKSFAHCGLPTIEDILHANPEFHSMEDLHALYAKGINLFEFASSQLSEELKKNNFKNPVELIRELTVADTTKDPHTLRFPIPQIIRENKDAWSSDEEFARQMLSGLNPLVIQRLQVFPPESKLDPKTYGSPTSSITAQHIEGKLEGFTVEEALKHNRLFILDYHDVYLPYANKINALKDKKTYASRTILFLTKEGTLKVVAIELSLPPTTSGGECSRRVFTPPPSGQKDWLWQLAKTHAIVNDSGYHQLISHWLRTHAAIEPFIIATNRQLSALHPLHVFLKPHFKNTMSINALARKSLINNGGIIEKTFTPGRYSIEMSSVVYRDWRFDEQGLPADLIKRGMAVKDPTTKHGLKLLIEDYPYAVDGLDVWFALRNWVRDYVSIHYEYDRAITEDTELQNWWAEIREVGHGDKADEKWWVGMRTREELEEVLTTFIWLTSAHHAAVNFGQYAYGGYVPNKATVTRQLIPEEGTEKYAEFLKNPEKFYLRTIGNEIQAVIVMATLEVLSMHASDEEYLGQRVTPNWSNDEKVLDAFKKFNVQLKEVEEEILKRNANPKLKNRCGEAKVAYTLLVPFSEEGMTAKGIPNSISI